MSQLSHRRYRSFLFATLLAVLLVTLVAVGPASHVAASGAATTPQATTPSAEDLGHYYVFRSRDNGDKPTSAMNAGCNNYFGVRQFLTLERLNALLFRFDADPTTGRIDNQTAGLLGHGSLCGVPGTYGNDIDAYVSTTFPGVGMLEAGGGCQVTPVIVTNLPVILNCVLQIKANAARNVRGGLVTSNSLLNVFNKSKSIPTGSVWTAQVIGNPVDPTAVPGPTPPNVAPDGKGLDFFVTRTRDETTPATSPECKRAGLTGTPVGIRTVNLAVAQPDANGRVPDEPGAAVGKMTVCYAYANRVGYQAFAIADLKTATKTFAVRAAGACRTTTTPAGPALRAQACSLKVKSGVKAGLITSNGLIQAGQPASAVNSGIWTFALFGAPPAS